MCTETLHRPNPNAITYLWIARLLRSQVYNIQVMAVFMGISHPRILPWRTDRQFSLSSVIQIAQYTNTLISCLFLISDFRLTSKNSYSHD